MMMIAFITINSGLVPLIEGLCAHLPVCINNLNGICERDLDIRKRAPSVVNVKTHTGALTVCPFAYASEKAVDICKRALDTCKRALNICKKALNTRKRALDIHKRAPDVINVKIR